MIIFKCLILNFLKSLNGRSYLQLINPQNFAVIVHNISVCAMSQLNDRLLYVMYFN